MGNCILEGVATEYMNSTLDIELPLTPSTALSLKFRRLHIITGSGGSIVRCVMRESAARVAVGDADTSCVCVCVSTLYFAVTWVWYISHAFLCQQVTLATH